MGAKCLLFFYPFFYLSLYSNFFFYPFLYVYLYLYLSIYLIMITYDIWQIIQIQQLRPQRTLGGTCGSGHRLSFFEQIIFSRGDFSLACGGSLPKKIVINLPLTFKQLQYKEDQYLLSGQRDPPLQAKIITTLYNKEIMILQVSFLQFSRNL